LNQALVIQTAFIGDAILATSVVEKLHSFFPELNIDLLVRKGNESLFKEHPFIRTTRIWNKKEKKYKNMYRLIKENREIKYDIIINLQRFMSTGLITCLSNSNKTIGFSKNPLSSFFTQSYPHYMEKGIHEIDRNLSLLTELTDDTRIRPKLYLHEQAKAEANEYASTNYITISPSSVWFTKQYAIEKWIEFCDRIDKKYKIYLLGSESDQYFCKDIVFNTRNINTINLAGKLSLLGSTALMKQAKMNYVNDSAPLHLASSVDAPVAAIFCSTTPDFGFGPLSTTQHLIESSESLTCKPCGIHGKKKCPEKHFNCAYTIDNEHLLNLL